MKEKIDTNKIVAFYNSYFHEIYTKALRIVTRSSAKIKVYISADNDVVLWYIVGEEDNYWVIESNNKIFCTCPDFVLYILGKRREREYCSHILAHLMCKGYSVDREMRDPRHACSPQNIVIDIKDFLNIIVADLMKYEV